MMISKILILGLLVFLVVGIATASQIFNNDEGSGVTLFVAIPQSMANFIENLPYVQNVDIHSDHTNIFMNVGENANQILETADLLEHKIIDNKANILTISGSPPMPMCMRDTSTEIIYGVYITNGQLKLVEGDELCMN